jgi:hypothetical protein
MAWPTTKAGTTNVDAGTDLIANARPDIKQNIDNVNSIMDFYDASGPYATQGNYTKQQYFGLQTLTENSAGTFDWDVSVAQTAKIAPTQTSTTVDIDNPVAGATYILIVDGSALGSAYTLTVENAEYPSSITPSFTANSKNVMTMIYDGTNMLIAYAKDFG